VASREFHKLADEIQKVANASANEEDLRIGVEKLLGIFLKDLEIKGTRGRYEYRLASGERIDALYGTVVIEYEDPKSFETKRKFDHAVGQAKDYIFTSSGSEDGASRYFGIVMDGFQIGFVRFRNKNWQVQGPVPVNEFTVSKFIQSLQGLKKRSLEVSWLVKDLGPGSEVAQKNVGAIYDALRTARTLRSRMLFDDWRRVFSQVCAYSPDKIRGLEATYKIRSKKIDYEALLFAVHTYYALVMKLLAAEVCVFFGGSPWMQSYLNRLETAFLKDRLKEELSKLEEGGIFIEMLGITNFLEADYFAWYIDEWNDEIARAFNELIKKLEEYDPATVALEPDKVKDLFKRLYQNLVPKKVRHDLGEFYTPDWLADLVLDEAGFTVENLQKLANEKKDPLAPLNLRLLDPACGSGTFLVLIIRRIRQYADENFVHEHALQAVLTNIVGFDLNPLAVMASRANFLLALGDLLHYRQEHNIEIPVYLTDSILVERKSTLTGDEYALTTTVGEFDVPVKIVETGNLARILRLIDDCVSTNYSSVEFASRLTKEGELSDTEAATLVKLFKQIRGLEKEGKNRIWVRLLKNSFAPLFKGKFDYVIGNPPWVKTDALPESYRKSSKTVWIRLGLIPQDKELGKVKRDISMAFVGTAFERYLVNGEGGVVSLLLPFTVFRTQAGDRFRAIVARRTTVVRVHDLVEMKPFEGAINRTAMIVARRGQTDFPVETISWSKTGDYGVDFDSPLTEVMDKSKRINLLMQPVLKNKSESPWLIGTSAALKAISNALGQSTYQAFEGSLTGLNGVYWIEVMGKQRKELVVRNLASAPGLKKAVEQLDPMAVESGLVYPLLRGSDVGKWSAKPSSYMIVPHDPRTGRPIDERTLKVDFPQAYKYFHTFEDDLRKRGIKAFISAKKKKLRRLPVPFYTVDNIAHCFAPSKAVWKYISGKISGKAQLFAAVMERIEDENVGSSVVVPDSKVVFVPCASSDEAHYITAVLNSSIARYIVSGYAVETAISTHILNYVRIPRFDPKNEVHHKLSELSRKAHALVARNATEELHDVEDKIDQLCAQSYGISATELSEIRDSLEILVGHTEETEAELDAIEAE
jgi:SAM-dependent methyltransferase